jgi:DNA-binding CsgD family transcriptional regulator
VRKKVSCRPTGAFVSDPELIEGSEHALDYRAMSAVLDIVDFASSAMSPQELCRGVAALVCKSVDGHQAVVGLQNRVDLLPTLIVVDGDQSYAKPYAEYYHHQDPADLTQYLSGKDPLHPSGSYLPRISTCDLVSLGEARRSEFYADFLLPQKVHYSLVTYLQAGPALRAVLCVHRERGRGPFSLSAVNMMEKLAPYLSANLARTVDQLVISAVETDDDAGVLIAGQDGRVVYCNSVAESFLRAVSGDELGTNCSNLISTLAGSAQRTMETEEGPYIIDAKQSSGPEGDLAWVIRIRKLSDPVTDQAARLRSRLGFTTREMEVLALIAQGCANKQIAGRLSVSEDTVKKHVQNMVRKANVSNRTGLVHVALRELSLTT